MKILIIQLARIGDIFQTRPVLSALKRNYPDAELHLLVRERFQAATVGLEDVTVHTLPTRKILEPIYRGEDVGSAIASVGQWLAPLQSAQFDRVINLSFSPTSSYIVSLVSHAHTVVSGYTRYTDGFLAIPDDASSYFYAQVGNGKSNRIHLTDLLALVAGVELAEDDFETPGVSINPEIRLPEKYVVVHLGASEAHKRLSPATWSTIIEKLLMQSNCHFVLVGASHERELVPTLGDPRIIDLVGKTELSDVIRIIKGAQALIGCDSMAVQIAALTHTKVFQFTFSSVRFWETGPRTEGSRMYWSVSPSELDVEVVIGEAARFLAGQPALYPHIHCAGGFGVIYDLIGLEDDDFAWSLTRALYMEADFPQSNDSLVVAGFQRLHEIAELGLEQVAAIQDPKRRQIAVSILNEVDHLLSRVADMSPGVGPVVRWFQTEKLRIGPGSVEAILASTRAIFERLSLVCRLYSMRKDFENDLSREGLTWK